MIRKAAASGIVDFKEARLLDRKWWLRLNWLLEEVETQECRKLLELKFNQHASALNYLAGNSFDHHWKHLNDLHEKWIALTFPWIKTRNSSSADESVNLWKKYIGDSSDPEVQARIQETIDSLKNRRPSTSPDHPHAWESFRR